MTSSRLMRSTAALLAVAAAATSSDELRPTVAPAAVSVPAEGAPEEPGVIAGNVESGTEAGASEAADVPLLEANATEQARMDLEAIAAAGGSNLRGAVGWGHGIFGETCCMCSTHVGFTTVLYAAEDYSNFWGGHNAKWRCQSQCEMKCHFKAGGHMFGCYDEQLILQMDRQYGHRSGYHILHDRHFGNIC